MALTDYLCTNTGKIRERPDGSRDENGDGQDTVTTSFWTGRESSS